MKIQLKEKHLCYIVNYLFDAVAAQYFDILYEIKNKLKAVSYQPDDMVEVSISKEDFTNVYSLLGEKQEYLTSGINREMKLLLQSQFQAKIAAYSAIQGTPTSPEEIEIYNEGLETLWVVDVVNARNQNADNMITELISKGRNLIN